MLCKKKSRSQAAFGTGRPALRSAAGFTLVELIVVIAILAILAGVGTVAYSGYIAHTNKQMDENLKNEIIYAGAVGSYANPGVTGTITVTMESATVNGVGDNKVIVEQWMADAFGEDWADTVRLRTNKVPIQDMRLPYYSVSEATAAALQTYLQSNLMGHEAETLGAVDSVAQTVSDLLNNPADFVFKILGKELDSEADIDSWVTEALTTLAGEDFYATYGLDENSSGTELSNALVLSMAAGASELSIDDAMWTAFNGYSSNGSVSPMERYGLTLATLTAYVNSGKASDEEIERYNSIVNGGDAIELFNLVNGSAMDFSDGVYEYFTASYDVDNECWNSEGEAYQDIAGYMAALQALNEYSGEFSGNLGSEGLYSSDETLALIQTILGNL